MKYSKAFVATAVSILAAIYSTPAPAKPVMSPAGLIDDSCVMKVPNGSTVTTRPDGTIEATLNGSIVATQSQCKESSVPNTSSALGKGTGSPGAGTSVWYDYSWTNATPISGLQQFDFAESEFVVPPPGPNDSSVLYLFSSLQSFTGPLTNCPASGCGTFGAIIQPILQWGYNNYNGDKYWIAEAGISSTTWIHSDPPCRVNSGDTIVGYVKQVGTSPDVWTIYIYDFTLYCGSTINYTVPTGAPKFNTFQGGVFEAYGNAAENTKISSCSDLPAGGGAYLQTLALQQAGPSWNSYHNVLGQSSWQAFHDCGPGAPCWTPTNCGWGTSASNNVNGSGQVGTTLTWHN